MELKTSVLEVDVDILRVTAVGYAVIEGRLRTMLAWESILAT